MKFDAAFSAARKAGKKTFTWNGKSYNTKLRSEASKGNGTPDKAPVPTSRPARLPDTAPVPTPRPKDSKPSAPASPKASPAPAARARVNFFSSAPESSSLGGKKMGVGSKVLNSIRVGSKAVDSGHRRDAAKKANAGAGSAAKKMKEGMK